MASFIGHWANFVILYRLPIICLAVLLLLVMTFTGPAIPFDNTTQRYFVEGDLALDNFDTLIDLFGDNEYAIVGIEQGLDSADVFNLQTLTTIAALTEFFESHRFVTQVRSLTNYQFIHGVGDSLSTDYLIEDIDDLIENPTELDQIRNRIRDERLATGTLVSEDFRHARITARIEYRDDTAAHKVALAQELYQFIEAQGLESDAYQLHHSGYPLLAERFETLVREDLQFIIPVMALLMLAMLYISFRTLAATLLPGLMITTGLLAVNEIQSYLGIPHSTVDQALLPTLIIIGVGITVHVLVEFYHAMEASQDSRHAAREAVINLWKPAFFTAITTSAGFLALSVIRIAPVREYALLGAIGPMLLFLLAMSLLPALLSYTSSLSQTTVTVINAGLVTRLTNSLPTFTLKYRNRILATGVACLAFAAYSIPKIQVDTNYVTLFKESSQVRQDILYLDRVFSGVLTLDIILDSGAAEGVKNPEFLRQVEEFQSWLDARESTGPINSLVDYLKEINQALNGNDPTFYRLPESREMAAQFLLLYNSSGTDENLSDLIDFDNRFLRLFVPIVNMTSFETQQEFEIIESHVRENYPLMLPLLTGAVQLLMEQDSYVAEGMPRSFITALLVMSLFFLILFRSLQYGLLCMVPSVLPILMTGGLAGLLGIYLDLSMMLVGAITMGIAVDDSIHVMNRYLRAKRTGATTHTAITHAMNDSGRAVVFSSAVLVLGFGVFCLASFTTVIYVGIFGSTIMLLALIGDLVLLPALLHWLDGDDTLREQAEIADVRA